MKVNKKTMPSVAINKEAKHAAQKQKKNKKKMAGNYLKLESKKPVPQVDETSDGEVADKKPKVVSEQVSFNIAF